MKTINQTCLPLHETGRAVINATRFLTRKNKKLNLPEFWILCSSCSKLLLGHINALSTIEDCSKRNRSLSKRIPDPCLSSKQSITFCKRRMFVRNFVNKLLKTFCQTPSDKILSRTQKKVLLNDVSLKDDDSSTTRKIRDSFLFNAVLEIQRYFGKRLCQLRSQYRQENRSIYRKGGCCFLHIVC